MGTFAETGNIDYHYHQQTKKKQTTVSHFPLGENEQTFVVAVFHLQQKNRSYHFLLVNPGPGPATPHFDVAELPLPLTQAPDDLDLKTS
jgi:hypothetical protein